jgi:glycosyltransferase involved in cell wall biosynthesis
MSNSKKILFYLSRYPGFGGVEKVTTILANYFVSNFGYEVIIASLEKEYEELLLPELSTKIVVEHCNIHNIEEELDFIIKKHGINTIIFQDSYDKMEKPLIILTKKYNIKLITVEHNTPNALFISSLNDFHKAQVNGLYSSIRKMYLLYKVANMWITSSKRHTVLLKNSSKYILLSSHYIKILSLMTWRQKLKNVHVINNPLTIKRPLSAEKLPKEKIILFASRLVSEKGVDKLLDIWAEFSINNLDWKLQIVGDGPLMDFVISYIKEHNLKNVFIEGYQSNMIPYFEKASILCMTSIYEGWGLVIVEAMSYGCVPVLYKSYLSVIEIIDDNINGHLIPAFEKNIFISCLNKLVNDKKMLENESNNAIIKSRKFSIDKIADDWKLIIEENID